ncbi:MAG: hypothetical protein EA376_00200 [Phycisphaeraceae bacterium]|nr:MAG: hypothetical protein EA376_00200 [Phycisphaeraceae bacterium]
MAKEGSTIGGLMDSLGTAVSVALQYGVPVESLVNKFAHQRFEPAGMTTNRDIPFAKSLVDYIFRWLGMEFVAGYREAVAPKRSGGVEKKPAESAGRGAPGRLKAAGDRFGTAAPGGGNGSTGGEQQPRPARQQTIGAVAFSGESMRTEVTDESGAVVSTTSESHVLSVALRDCQGDAPACEVCGTITVRNGACYKCLNCGHSMGCS